MASQAAKAAALAVREKLRVGTSGKVQRYRAGKAPEWVHEEGIDDEDEDSKPQLLLHHHHQPPREAVKEEHKIHGSRKLPDDPRLRRVAQSRSDRREAVARHREIRQAEIVSTTGEEEEEYVPVEDEDAEENDAEEKRRRNRERILQKQREEEEAATAQAAGNEEDTDEESEEEEEFETESEEETAPRIKPVFVRKSERETIAERERLEAEEEAVAEEMQRKLELRKVETKQMVVNELRKEEEQEKNKIEDLLGEDVETDDETNEEEYEMWKAREMMRIKTARGEKEAAMKEKEEIEKLRGMTEEERKEWERKNPKEKKQEKKKWSFMQKYYHKGAFFQTETDDTLLPGGDQVYKRDYSEATGEDKLNRSILPKVMQVKNWGKSGRSKWTHLVNEDTSQRNAPWYIYEKQRVSYKEKMGGMDQPMQRPQGSKKMKRNVDELYQV